MGDVPSVKGVAFQHGWERVRALIESGRIPMEELEFRLGSEGMELVDGKPEPSLWYPLVAADRLTELLIHIEGGGDREYARELGRQGLETVLGRGAVRGLLDGARRRGERAGHTLIGLAGLVYNFGMWSYRGEDLDRFEVVVQQASPFRTASLLAAAGFIEALVEHFAGSRVHVEVLRPEDDRVVFRAESA